MLKEFSVGRRMLKQRGEKVFGGLGKAQGYKQFMDKYFAKRMEAFEDPKTKLQHVRNLYMQRERATVNN